MRRAAAEHIRSAFVFHPGGQDSQEDRQDTARTARRRSPGSINVSPADVTDNKHRYHRAAADAGSAAAATATVRRNGVNSLKTFMFSLKYTRYKKRSYVCYSWHVFTLLTF